jgi:hypothetical protein
MTRTCSGIPRRGYSLTIVLIFLILLFALWGMVHRTTSSLLRIETNRVMHDIRNQGAMNVLARALQLLQYSQPSDRKNPYRTQFAYGAEVSTTTAMGTCEIRAFTVEFVSERELGPKRWEVHVYPGQSRTPLPMPGATPQWP